MDARRLSLTRPTPAAAGADQVYDELAAAIREGVNSI